MNYISEIQLRSLNSKLSEPAHKKSPKFTKLRSAGLDNFIARNCGQLRSNYGESNIHFLQKK